MRLVGDGPELGALKALAHERGIGDLCEFTGFLRGEPLLVALSSFDIGVIPDPFDVYNDKISMNKVFEYATLGLPIVAYNLRETRRLLGDAALYARDNTVASLGQRIGEFLADSALRREMGARAAALATRSFRWDEEVRKLLAAYDRALRLSGQAATADIASGGSGAR